MREQEVRNLWEAYLEVCENQQLDEVSDELVGRSVNARIARSGAANDAEMKDRTPENMRNSVRAGEKEASMKTAAAKRKKRINKEEVETWVNSLIEEGYDLSDYTWEEMYETYANLNEGRTTSLSALSRESQKRKDDKKRGRPETESETHSRLAMGKFRPGASQEERAEGGRQVLKDRGKVPKKGGKDMFEHILEYLVAEGYADTNESALVIMANMSEEWREDIMEISQKTATTVYGTRRSSEFDGDDGPDRIKNTNKLRDRIGKKFGDEAVKNADAHADSRTFGRTDSRTGKRQERPQSRTQRPNTYRTRADGKMHGQDQNTLKAKLQKRRPSDSDN